MKKEQFEWINSWCDEADKNDLPRVLMIGDSITFGVYEFVKESLKGKAYVDRLTSSYALDNPLYKKLVTEFVKNSKYQAIYFNNGLHGYHLKDASYKRRVEPVIEFLNKSAKMVIALSTIVYLKDNKKVDSRWDKKVKERNLALKEIAEKNGINVVDLYEISAKTPLNLRNPDGTHYEQEGYKTLAEAITKELIEALDENK